MTNYHYTAFCQLWFGKVGEWVLAVGKLYNLTSTVTVESFRRKPEFRHQRNPIFIQTDAVNPGNSGGALVNTRAVN
jgi:S1-C subfamily serine protease